MFAWVAPTSYCSEHVLLRQKGFVVVGAVVTAAVANDRAVSLSRCRPFIIISACLLCLPLWSFS